MFKSENKNFTPITLLKLIINSVDKSLIFPVRILCRLIEEMDGDIRTCCINKCRITWRIHALVTAQTLPNIFEATLRHGIVIRSIFICKDKNIAPVMIVASRINT